MKRRDRKIKVVNMFREIIFDQNEIDFSLEI